MKHYSPYIRTFIVRFIIQAVVIIAIIIFMAILGSCAAPKAVDSRHHRYYEADTMAVKAHVDSQMKILRQQMDSLFSEHFSQYNNQQQQTEHQQETIHETVTTTLDSLGREMRQEQRTITRDITREQQILEQRITREMESRLQQAVSSLDSTWQLRYDSLRSSVIRGDSTAVTETPVAVDQDNRPWYRRIWDGFSKVILGAAIVIILLVLRKYNLLRKYLF